MTAVGAIRYVAVCATVFAASAYALPVTKNSATRQMLVQVPLSFEANKGQADSAVKFLSRGDGYALLLTSKDAVFKLASGPGAKSAASVVRMQLLGANDGAEISSAEKLAGTANYFIGNDPKKWHSGVPSVRMGKASSIRPM